MLDHIIKFSIKNKLIIGVCIVGLIGWGIYSVQQLPIDAVPDITNNQVQIITSAPSQSAQDIERLVTFPIEITMASIPNIEEVRSFSRFGLSVVTVVFKDNVDIYWARQQINERLATAKNQIPEGIGTPIMAPLTSGLGEIYQYTIYAKEGYEEQYPAMELRSIQDWIVRRQLLGIEGVADVSSFGGFLKQYEVAIQPEKLVALKVTINEVFEALAKNNENTGGAYIDKNPKAFFIRSQGLIQNLDDIKKIVVKSTTNGTPILIKDIGDVSYGNAVRYGAMTRNGEGEVVGAIVMMLKGANSSKVISNVKNRISQIKESLPEGVAIRPFLDRTTLVNKAIGTVTTNLIEGALIVIFILVLFLGNLRAGLIVASVIPLAMLFAISCMNLFGVSGNLMSLGAIDFGIIVDGSVIIVEATLHYLGLKKSSIKFTQKQMDIQVYTAASKIRTSAAFGEIIILIVYLPILALVGIEGKMFKPMALAVSFAILGAFILSLTYVPMMSALFLSKKRTYKKTISDRIIERIQKLYTPALNYVLTHKKKVLIGSISLFLISLFVFNTMGSEFIPSLDEGDFAVETRVSTGSSVTHTVDAVNRASRILLREFPDEINEIVGKIGSSEIPTDPMPIEAADLMIILKDKKEWKVTRNKNHLATRMQSTLDKEMVGVTFGFQQPIQMRFNELMTGARQDVVVKVYGEGLDKLVSYGNQIASLIPSIKGAEDLYVEKMTGLQQIVIQYNRNQLAYYGLNISDVNATVNTAFAGQVAGAVYEGEKRFDLVVRLANEHRASLSDVENLFITAPNGAQIPLANIAKVAFTTGPNQIQRDDAKRRITIGFNVRGRDVASIVEELQQKIGAGVSFNSGYYITYGGTFKNLEEARNRLFIAVPVALSLIFLLLYVTFSSVKQSILIFTAIPMSAIGGIFALWIRGMPFSISAGIGFIALFGVAVLNGIVLIAEFNRIKETGVSNVIDIVKRGTSVRLRPVILTALVASLGFLPMALSESAGAEVQKPLATVVIGGLVSATLLTLLILPVLYVLFETFTLKKVNASKSLLTFICVGCVSILSAQEPVQKLSEDEVVKRVLTSSVSLHKAKVLVNNSRLAVSGTFKLSPLSIRYQEVGLSAGITEKEWSINQNFGSIAGHIQQKKLAEAANELATANYKITEKQVVRDVKTLYQKWHYLYAQLSLFEEQQAHSYQLNSMANTLYENGEIGGLENDVTAIQTLNIASQKSKVYAQFLTVENNLKEMLQLKENITPVAKWPLKKEWAIRNVQLATSFLEVIEKSNQVAEKKVSLAKSVYFPEFTAGIVNRKAGSAVGFTGFNIGLNVPLSIWSTKASIRKQRALQESIAYKNSANSIAVHNQINSLSKQVDYLNSALENSKRTKEKATRFLKKIKTAYQAGEIDAYQYSQSFNAYFQIMQNYLTLINTYNQSVIAYEFYTKE